MGKKERKNRRERCQLKLISGVLKMINKKVPIMLLWQNKGEIQKIGTRNMLNWYDGLDEEVKQGLRSCMVEDIIRLNQNKEEMAEKDKSKESEKAALILKSLSPASELSCLPFPLSLMNKKQKTKFLSERIFVEAGIAGVPVVYGSPFWRPSFWQEDVWAWQNLSKPLSKVTEAEFTGAGSFGDFLEILIRSVFAAANRDPEVYVEDTASMTETMKKKERARGINRKPTIIRTEQRCQENAEAEGTVTSFKPRRNVGVSPFKNVVRNLDDQLATVSELPVIPEIEHDFSPTPDPRHHSPPHDPDLLFPNNLSLSSGGVSIFKLVNTSLQPIEWYFSWPDSKLSITPGAGMIAPGGETVVCV